MFTDTPCIKETQLKTDFIRRMIRIIMRKRILRNIIRTSGKKIYYSESDNFLCPKLNSSNADGNPISNLHEVQRANFKPAPTER